MAPDAARHPSPCAAPHLALRSPIDRHTHRLLRAAVLELVEGEARRHFPTVLHAGEPHRAAGGARVAVPVGHRGNGGQRARAQAVHGDEHGATRVPHGIAQLLDAALGAGEGAEG